MRVLVADDDLVSRMLLSQAVMALGHECQMATDGADAWEQYQAELPDVLITDWMMPGVDGIELTKRVRSAGASGYTYVMVATSLALWPIADTSLFYPIAAAVLGAIFLVEGHRMWARAKTSDELSVINPMRLFHMSNLYLSLLFVAVALDPLFFS